MLPSKLSAGTGPAALILIGGVFIIYLQNAIGWLLIGGGILLSVFWKMKF